MSDVFERTVELVATQGEDVLSCALRRGGSIAGIFAEESTAASASLRINRAGPVENRQSQTNAGAGIHVFDAASSTYAFTDDLSAAGLRRSAAEASRAFRISAAARPVKQAQSLSSAPIDACTADHPYDTLDRAPDAEVRALLRRAADAAQSLLPDVSAVNVALQGRFTRFVVASSDGRFVRSARSTLNLRVQLRGRDGRAVHAIGGGAGGLGLFLTQRPEDIAREAAERLEAVAGASGKGPRLQGDMHAVVIAGGWGGVWLHEVIGHALEADVGLFAPESIGERIAGDAVTVVDDSTLAGGRGGVPANDSTSVSGRGGVPADDSAFASGRGDMAADDSTFASGRGDMFVDDEGSAGGRTVLIENGVLRGLLTDRASALRLGLPETGNGRRQDYRHAPLPRMSNLVLAAGSATPSELLKEADLYVKMIGSGKVDPTEDTFSFDVVEGYVLENGRSGRPVTGMRLHGRASEMLRRVVGIADDFRLDPGRGTCEKKGQVVPVSVGMPTILVDRMTIAPQI